MNLRDQVILITGASAGIGEVLARRLAREGVRLVLAARSLDKLNRLSEELGQLGCRSLAVRADVSDPNDLQELVDAAKQQFGRIDVLINNAGVECFRHFENIDTEDVLQTIETNLTGAILLTRLVVPLMLEQKSGCIVNMASTAGKHCPPFGCVYGATKAALIGFTQGLRGEFLDRGIRSTAICPGFTTNGGVYDRAVQATGKKTSLALGGTSADAVASAVLKAIRSGPPELVVNWPPVRPAMVLREIFPRLGELLATAVSRKFVRRAADAADASRNGH
ncbi:MAG: SDR family oxidoreductase [Planctomycetaceae bacterium]